MKRKSRFPRCQTLRLDERLDDLVTEVAFDRRTTKAAWIRAAIRHGIANERMNSIRHNSGARS